MGGSFSAFGVVVGNVAVQGGYSCTFCERTRIIGDSSDVKTAIKIRLQASLTRIFTAVFPPFEWLPWNRSRIWNKKQVWGLDFALGAAVQRELQPPPFKNDIDDDAGG